MTVPCTNTTCDIYRDGRSPPAAPDVSAVACLLEPKGDTTSTTDDYTHVLLVPPTTDIRDGYTKGSFGTTTGADRVYIPDQNGTKFEVVLVRRKGRGTPLDHKAVLLVRQPGMGADCVNWPTDDL